MLLSDDMTAEELAELNAWRERQNSQLRRLLSSDTTTRSAKPQRAAMAWFLRAISSAIKQIMGVGIEAFVEPPALADAAPGPARTLGKGRVA